MQKEKAKRFLASYLLSLMEQKPYEKINISEICSAAFLSRPSFYKYFSSKDELLCYQFRALLSPELDSAEGEGAARLAQCLSHLTGYTQVISEQRLLAMLLPELAEMLKIEDTSERGMFSVCHMYLSLLFAVRRAPGLRAGVILRYWREAMSGTPDSVHVPPGEYADNIQGSNALLIADALLASAWHEFGIERFAALYTAVLNEVSALPDDDIPGDQLYMYRLQSACFAAKRTALLYCFL